MIAKYHDTYFNVRIENGNPRIWTYRPFEDFSHRVSRGGNNIYEKIVDMTDIDSIFDIGFSVLWNGEWCGFEYSAELNKLEVYSNDPDFAKKHGMETVDRLFYSKIIQLNDVTDFRVVFKDTEGYITHYTHFNSNALAAFWKQFKTDLMPR